jgi:protein BCP1
MPAEIVPPMYSMLLEEIQWALEEKEPYQFSHYLILSKVYSEVESQLDQQESRPKKKNRREGAQAELFYFHPEDEVLQKHSVGYATYDYTKQSDDGAADSKRAFQEMGIKPQGHIILIEASKFGDTVGAIKEYVGAPAQ